ncbi:MAG: hypothetical protein II923_03790 [Campylobacter sp.]|nr:hypothetical protein [Campylobacter sp.]MBQ7271594.1 hypothetical protein [Campylobacter sp.]
MENGNLNDKENSKNKNLRDYDKEPIIIEDRKYFFYAIGIIIFSILVYLYLAQNSSHEEMRNNAIIFAIFSLPYIRTYFTSRNQRFIVFKNDYVEYKAFGKIQTKIKYTDIDNIKKPIFVRNMLPINEFLEKNKILLYIVYIIGFSWLLWVIYKAPVLLLIFMGILFVNVPIKTLYYLFFKRKFRFFFFDTIVITSNLKSIDFEISDKNEYEMVRRFLLIKANIDLNNAKHCHSVVNSEII